MERLCEIEHQLSFIEEVHPTWVEEVTPEAFLAVMDIFLIFTLPANIRYSLEKSGSINKAEVNIAAYINAFNKLLKDHCNVVLPTCE